jgi:predicted nucleic acid-binding protein
MRIFLDANILFSAAKSAGAVRLLLELLTAAGHECWADSYVIEEARRNLATKAPAGLAALEMLLSGIRITGFQPHEDMFNPGVPLPDKDQPVLAAAIRCGCAALVTGDRTHFGPLYGKTIHGVTIYSPRSLAEVLLRKRKSP